MHNCACACLNHWLMMSSSSHLCLPEACWIRWVLTAMSVKHSPVTDVCLRKM